MWPKLQSHAVQSHVPMLSRVRIRLMQSCRTVCTTEKQGIIIMTSVLVHNRSNSTTPIIYWTQAIVWLLGISNGIESSCHSSKELHWEKAWQSHQAGMSKDKKNRFSKLSFHNSKLCQLAENVCSKVRTKISRKLHLQKQNTKKSV